MIGCTSGSVKRANWREGEEKGAKKMMDAVIEALAMGKHGPFVWSAYLIYGLLILGWGVHFKRRYQSEKQLIIKQRRRAEFHHGEPADVQPAVDSQAAGSQTAGSQTAGSKTAGSKTAMSKDAPLDSEGDT